MSKAVQIWTDGACSGNPGPGGWGALLRWGERELEICGGEANTTNNRMELQAAIEALRRLKQPCSVDLYTDSVYVQQGISSWLPQWQRRNWKTAAGKAVKNQELWQDLLSASEAHTVNWQWVKGHAGDPGNERADALARQGMEQARA